MNTERPDDLVVLGRVDHRGRRGLFGIRGTDRFAHTYVVGKTGTGKSTLLETMIRQDLEAGRGVALLDPHGDLVERVLKLIPERRRGELTYFDVPDTSRVLGFNPVQSVEPARRPLAASGILEAFKKIWAEFWGPRLEHILRNAILTLLDQPQATLADVLRLLDDPSFRRAAVANVRNPQVRAFWLREYEQYPFRLRYDAIAPVQNKVGAFLAHPILNRILTQPRSSFDLREVMDSGRILLVNLSKGRLGEDAASLLGALIVSAVGSAALGRADAPASDRRDFFLYLDEFHLFTTRSIAGMLAELRKFRVGLVLAHQYLGQLDEAVLDAVLGNVGTLVTFRLGLPDAELLAKDLQPFTPADLTSAANHKIHVRLMHAGETLPAFSGTTLAPREDTALGHK